jgi:hypothetical protein
MEGFLFPFSGARFAWKFIALSFHKAVYFTSWETKLVLTILNVNQRI